MALERKNISDFVHLHVHSDYSLLTGMAKVEELVAKAKADGQSALALTDLGVMYGIIDFYQCCKEKGIKPIVGAEIFIAPYGRMNKRPKIDEERHSLILLVKDEVGYQNLMKIISIGFLEGFYYRPRVDMEVLTKYSAGLIALTGTLNGEIPKAILKNFSQEKLDEVVDQYLNIFGPDNVYIELFRTPSIGEQEVVNKKLIELADRRNIKYVAAANSYYLNTEDDRAHDILLCIKNNRKVFEDNRFTMIGEDYSLLSREEMTRRFSDLPLALDNSVEIANKCNLKIEFGVNRLPSFKLPPNITYDEYLREICMDGILKRYGGKLTDDKKSWIIGEDIVLIKNRNQEFRRDDILKQLDYELEVIAKTGYASYFLIVSDFITWSKDNGIVVGPGRGSAAGSLVAYLTRITELDPLEYELLFERFLNPDRIDMPDIDTDFADERREDVINYVRQKYGEDKVSGIITFGTLGAKAVVRDVGRALGVEYSYCDKVAKLIPTFSSLSDALKDVPDLKSEFENNDDCKSIMESALKLEGVHRHASKHACGILITKDPLVEHVPIQFSTNGVDETLVSQYSLDSVGALGLLKMDFLGLSNLTIIQNTLETIEKLHGNKPDLSKLDFNNEKTFALLQRGETTGVFQFESAGMKRYLKLLKPTGIEDIIAMGALYRPGPLDAGMVDEYIARKNGQKEITYMHPKLEPILKPTYGVIVYQEQVMRIARDLAGFTLGQADLLRKAVGKKIKELMDEQRNMLIDGMLKYKVEKKVAHEIWRQIETFARYGFNRSHAACYGMISYQTAYLKANYPAEFMASLMTADLNDIDRISIEVSECRSMGMNVLSPDVNESYSRFTVVAESLKEENPRIRFGLSAIKGVGENIAKQIIHERRENGPYESLDDFLLRVNSKDLNKKSLDSLIRAGALDRFGERNEMLMNMERIQRYLKENHQDNNKQQTSLFSSTEALLKPVLILEKFEHIDKKVMLAWEKELLGFYLSEHPFEDFGNQLAGYIYDTATINKEKPKGNVRVGGLISSIKKIVTKKGDLMLFVNLEDTKGMIEVIVFPTVYGLTSNEWVENGLVIVSGSMSDRDGEVKVICNEIKTLDEKIIETLKRTLTRITGEIKEEVKNLFIFFQKTIGADTINALANVCKLHQGSNKVFLAVPLNEKKFRKIETNFSVDLNSPDLFAQLNQLAEVKMIKMM